MHIPRSYIALVILGLFVCALCCRVRVRQSFSSIILTLRGEKTISDRVEQYGSFVHERLAADFNRAGISYPPAQVVLVGFKSEKKLEVWAKSKNAHWQFIKDYKILGLSGTLGPKLKEGDQQVPEGIYRVESLNPNSLYHLAIRLNYPNRDDRQRGAKDGRTNLGSDIMIHGGNLSIGCLAMGNEAAEDLFVLVADTGIKNVEIVLSPVDFRIRTVPAQFSGLPLWTKELYSSIRIELDKLEREQ